MWVGRWPLGLQPLQHKWIGSFGGRDEGMERGEGHPSPMNPSRHVHVNHPLVVSSQSASAWQLLSGLLQRVGYTVKDCKPPALVCHGAPLLREGRRWGCQEGLPGKDRHWTHPYSKGMVGVAARKGG